MASDPICRICKGTTMPTCFVCDARAFLRLKQRIARLEAALREIAEDDSDAKPEPRWSHDGLCHRAQDALEADDGK
jgi:hypothetical protein